jgi:hypothetical protein
MKPPRHGPDFNAGETIESQSRKEILDKWLFGPLQYGADHYKYALHHKEGIIVNYENLKDEFPAALRERGWPHESVIKKIEIIFQNMHSPHTNIVSNYLTEEAEAYIKKHCKDYYIWKKNTKQD